MRISFSPQRRDGSLTVEQTSTDVLKINGSSFNFSSLPDGATIPAGEVPSEWIVGPVERIDGVLHITIVLPHGPNPSQAVAFPEPVTVAVNGAVSIPHDEEPADVDA